MKIEKELTLSYLKDNFQQLYDEARTENSIEVHSEFIDTAGLQFLIALKKNHPGIEIELVSAKSRELASLLGADKCL